MQSPERAWDTEISTWIENNYLILNAQSTTTNIASGHERRDSSMLLILKSVNHLGKNKWICRFALNNIKFDFKHTHTHTHTHHTAHTHTHSTHTHTTHTHTAHTHTHTDTHTDRRQRDIMYRFLLWWKETRGVIVLGWSSRTVPTSTSLCVEHCTFFRWRSEAETVCVACL